MSPRSGAAGAGCAIDKSAVFTQFKPIWRPFDRVVRARDRPKSIWLARRSLIYYLGRRLADRPSTRGSIIVVVVTDAKRGLSGRLAISQDCSLLLLLLLLF